jgi:hypothetical protein
MACNEPLTERYAMLPKLQLTFVKNPKPPKTEEPVEETVHPDYAQIVRDSSKTVFTYAALAVAGWVALDTARQCAVKATPQH